MTTCREIRTAIQERLDGPIAAEIAASVTEHLRECAACRAHEDGLRSVSVALGALAEVPFPDEALEAVWARTTRAPRAAALRRTGTAYGWAAAAAVLLTAALLPALLRPVVTAPTGADVARARDEARLVLALAAGALRRTERAGDRLLTDDVAPAFRKIPIRWPGGVVPEPRRSRS